MPVTHAFVNPIPDDVGFPGTKPSDWNAAHVISVINADVDPAAAIDESKLNLNYPTLPPSAMGEISYFSMVGTNIVIAAQSDGSTNMVKAAPATTLANHRDFDNGGADNGRLRYTGAETLMFHVACTISIAPAAVNDTFVFGVAKSGTVIASSKVLLHAQLAAQPRSTAMHVMVELAQNEYLEMFVGNTTDTDDCTVRTLNLFAMGMQ